MDDKQQAELFRECRRRLKMSVTDLQIELCLSDERVVRRMEEGGRPIMGPTWVALMFLLDEEGLTDLADRIHEHVRSIQDGLEADRKRRAMAARAAADGATAE